MQETQVWSPDREDPLEKEMATHSSILAWKLPGTEEPGGLRSMGSQRIGHDSATKPPPASKSSLLNTLSLKNKKKKTIPSVFWWSFLKKSIHKGKLRLTSFLNLCKIKAAVKEYTEHALILGGKKADYGSLRILIWLKMKYKRDEEVHTRHVLPKQTPKQKQKSQWD